MRKLFHLIAIDEPVEEGRTVTACCLTQLQDVKLTRKEELSLLIHPLQPWEILDTHFCPGCLEVKRQELKAGRYTDVQYVSGKALVAKSPRLIIIWLGSLLRRPIRSKLAA